MELFFFTVLLLLFLSITISLPTRLLAAAYPSCKNTCGSLPIKYPLGTGFGCGSPRFQSSLTCTSSEQLLLTTHTGRYPVTSISYATSTLTLMPPLMSTCSSMHPSPNFGLDWASPFQLGPSLFLLLSCSLPSSSITFNGSPLCATSKAHLCAFLYSCPAASSLSLPLFAPSNSCCVYSPANLGPHMDLDLQGLKCTGFSSVVSFGDSPAEIADPNRWVYGVSLQFGAQSGLDGQDFSTSCGACEKSNGVCGYAPPRNYFVCVCQNGVNSSTDCYGQVIVSFENSAAAPTTLPVGIFHARKSLWLAWFMALGFRLGV